MFSFLKSKNQNIIELGVLSPIEPLKNIMLPSIKNLPEWWTSFPKLPELDIPSWDSKDKVKPILTTHTCPSFIDFFKNSYVVKSPCDWLLEVEPGRGYRFSASNSDVLGNDNHSIKKQMNNFADSSLENLKLQIMSTLISTSKLTKLIMTSPIYFNPNFPLDIMPGILPLTPKHPLPLHLNYFINPNKKIKYKCREGEVIAVLYCTEKILPKIKIKDGLHYFPYQTKWKGNFINYLKNWR